MTKQQFLKTFGQRIKAARLVSGLSQAELARRIKMSRTQITNIETGKSDTSLWTIAKIAFACKVDLDTLFKRK